MASGWSWSTDSRRVRVRLKAMRERAGDLTPAFEKWGDDVAEEVRLNFASDGARFGHAWAALSPEYAAWKATHFPGKTILRRTDKLFDSVTKRPFAIERIGTHQAEFGTDVDYAKYHKTGTDKMPSRPFLELTAALQRKVNNRILDHIMGES